MTIYQTTGDHQRIALCLGELGRMVQIQTDDDKAETLYEESLRLYKEVGDKTGHASALAYLGELAQVRGNAERAITLYKESLALRQEAGDRRGIAHVLYNLGNTAFERAEYTIARTYHQESLTICQSLGDRRLIASSLDAFAKLAGTERKMDRSARLLGAAAMLRKVLGALLPPVERLAREQFMFTVRSIVGEERFATAWAEGQAMTLEQAIAHALEESY